MMKKILVLLLAAAMVASLIPLASANGTSIMYVKTENGKSVNVRSSPNLGDNIIGTAPYGHEVLTDWSYAGNDGWTRVVWGSLGDGYIMSRFLVSSKPEPYRAPTNQQTEAEDEKKKLDAELKSEKTVAEPFYIAARPARASGWVNFRTGPSVATTRIRTLPDGKELIVIGETSKWYKARDPETDKVGYISKRYTSKLAKKYVIDTPTDAGVQKLGSLNVNGEFDLTCRLPEGFNLQVVNMRGDKIVASVLSDDMTKPQMYLSIAYDESYGDVDRLNDMSYEDLALLESTFSDMNEVEITYRETGHGTKLLVARETGSDTDFVDILAIYKGYFIEFNMTPNPKAAVQTLTDEQIQLCVDFLTDVDFTPVQK
ncbi:MAG: SH3 domain-containing protein [Clostridia bacterium]|nr:SH3 domain-containing protein [Clostridia bacterium]